MINILQKRQFRLLLACIALLLLVNLITDTYAKYISSANANSDLTIASWAFLVNNQDVLQNADFSNTIVPVFDTDANIASGVIAPTSTGYFDVTIDSSDVNLAFDETITLAQGTSNTVSDLVFTGYTLNGGTLVPLNNLTTTTITSNHTVNEQTTTNTYRFYIAWNDDANTQTMNNAADTAQANTGTASVSVNINFIQRASSN